MLFTMSRDFSLHPLHSKVKLSNIPKHFLHTFFSAHQILSRSTICCNRLLSLIPNLSEYLEILSMPLLPQTFPFFPNVPLGDHSFNLRSVNFINSASEMGTKYIEIKLFNNLKC